MAADTALLLNESVWHGKVFGGDWTAASGGSLDVIEPATGKLLTRIGRATAADVANAAAAAAAAQPGWVAMPPEDRAAILRKAAMVLEQHISELAPWISRETGGLLAKGEFEVHYVAKVLHAAAAMVMEPQGLVLPSTPGRLSYARRVPHGVVGVISPFNFPLVLSMRAVAPALAAGNAVVLKPDPRTTVTGGYIVARILEEAGLPKGVLQLMPGGADAGEALCTDPHIGLVCFTGSTAVGRRIGELCGKNLKKVSLELGGKSSMIILEDADLELAASNVAWGAYFHQGQICMATGRVLVQQSIVDAFTARLVEHANHLPVGDPASGKVALGPLISQRQLDNVHAIVQGTVQSGATLMAGGTYEGLFYRPTVLTGVRPGMRSFEEEVFGPVASIVGFSSDDEAVALANQTEYGLSGAVVSASIGRAMAIGNRLNTGLLHINDQTVADEPQVPFGGRGVSGNGGRVGGPSNWEEFTQWQWVTIKDKPNAYPF